MANREQPQSVFQERLGFHEERRTFASESVATTRHRVGFWSQFLHHEWSSAALYLFLDVASWIAIYRIVGWFRYDAFYATPFQFFIINVIQLGVIVAALYFVGGYDRTVEKLTLGYAAEHILAITAAAAVSAMLVYSAATFDQTMKPSRGVLLLSFTIFLPLSLAYRRWIRQYVVASSANRSFLVIGSGAAAAHFYEAYKKSSNSQHLEFVDVNDARVGQPIAGEGSPIVQGNLPARLDNLGDVTAASSSLRKRTPSIPNYWNGLCTRSSGKREFTPWSLLRNTLALCAAGHCRSVLAVADGISTGAHFALSLPQAGFRYRRLGNGAGPVCSPYLMLTSLLIW